MSPSSRPLYLRVLRVRHLRPGPWVLLVFFEGSIALALVLLLAGLVSAWALLAIPAAVAAMVKLNDAVAGTLRRPLALAPWRTPRARDEPAVGRSRVPGRTYASRYRDLNEGPADAKTWIASSPVDPPEVARGVARVSQGDLPDEVQMGTTERARGNRGRFSR
jgi:hypothetical protein